MWPFAPTFDSHEERSGGSSARIYTCQLTPEAFAVVVDKWRKQIKQANKDGDVLKTKNLLSQFVRALVHKSLFEPFKSIPKVQNATKRMSKVQL